MIKEKFVSRHLGPRESEYQEMLKKVGVSSLDQLIDEVVPKDIRLPKKLVLDPALTEYEYLNKIKEIAS